jgi:hypothetical protein
MSMWRLTLARLTQIDARPRVLLTIRPRVAGSAARGAIQLALSCNLTPCDDTLHQRLYRHLPPSLRAASWVRVPHLVGRTISAISRRLPKFTSIASTLLRGSGGNHANLYSR